MAVLRSQGGSVAWRAVPHGQWQSTTFIAGLRVDALTAPMVLDGPMDGAAFRSYVRNFLCPTLQPGDIVIADNLSSHKVAGVRETIEAAGASFCHLPAYSPDFNPIENLFAKLKVLLKKTAHRTVEALLQEIGNLLDAFSPAECANYFKAAGYTE
jgi:transposase